MTMVRIEIGTSGIHGLGCFAMEDIEEGQLVWKFDGRFDLSLTREFVDSLPEGARENLLVYAFISRNTGHYILCSDDSKFTNHSVAPNVSCRVPVDAVGDELECYATSAIKCGEEITNDYADFHSGFTEGMLRR